MPERYSVDAQAQSTNGRTDSVRLAVEGIDLEATHGVYEAEKEHPQRFQVDVEMEADIEAALISDQLEDTVDHESVVRIVQEVSRGRQFNLIESFAHAICCTILDRHPRVQSAHVTVRKLAPYNLGSTACTRAEVRLSRDQNR